MTDLFYMGGPLFMGILTLIFLITLSLATLRAMQIVKDGIDHESTFRHKLIRIKSIGLLALVVGIFAQLLGLYDAFTAIEQAGAISPALLAGGLKVSMITTLYGIVIFLVSYLLWLVLDYSIRQVGHR